MGLKPTPIEGLFVFEPAVHIDDRGYFFESFREDIIREAGFEFPFIQDNEASSTFGVLRGLHYQYGDAAQAKIVRVSQGEVLDVVVDIRPGSSTYGEHYAIQLSQENKLQLLIPRGFAHGYIVLSKRAVFQYKCDNYYDRNMEGGLMYNDPKLDIDWLLPEKELILSEKDKKWPSFGNHQWQ